MQNINELKIINNDDIEHKWRKAKIKKIRKR